MTGHAAVASVDLAGVPEDCWRFFETLFTCSPRVGNVRQLSALLGIVPSTLMSRDSTPACLA